MSRTGGCAACRRVGYLHSRGLCRRCWGDPAVRAAHPPLPAPRAGPGQGPRCLTCKERAANRGPGGTLCRRCATPRDRPAAVVAAAGGGMVDVSARLAAFAVLAEQELPLFTGRRPPAWRV